MDLVNPAGEAAASVAYTGTAGSTSAFTRGPRGVLVWATSDAYIAIGEGVTATASNSTPIPANVPVCFAVPPGTGSLWRVSAIQVSAGGSVYAKPLAG